MIHRLRAAVLAGIGLLTLTFTLAGCGGGGSKNIDDGVFTDGRRKSIQRTLENRSDLDLEVDLRINGQAFLDRHFIPARDFITVTVDNLLLDDYIRYDARFENNDTTGGTFNQDGLTVFTHSGRAGGRSAALSQDQDGKQFVRTDGKTLRLDAAVVPRK
jgi:hypothetical protein